MKTGFLFRAFFIRAEGSNTPPFRAGLLIQSLFLFFTVCVFPLRGAERTEEKEKSPMFTWDLLWTGSWDKSVKTPDSDLPPAESPALFSGGTLYNRGNLSLGMPARNLSFRFLATDKRVLPPAEDDGKAGFNPGAGIYHKGSGSRFIYGVQSEYGLPARINRVWTRAVPFMEARSPSSRDLKAEPSERDESEAYLYLGLPGNLLPGFDAFASAALDKERNPAFGGGIGWHGEKIEARLEGFYTRKELAPRPSQGWFSAQPPLPERDFNIYALALTFHSPWVLFAADWAWSEMFAWGSDLYGNFALRLGNKPWRFSLAADGAGIRFADRSGSTAGPGLRFAAKGERFWPRSGLLRFQGNLRSPGLEEDFDYLSFSAYFRPPAPSAAQRRSSRFPVRFSRASLGVKRDAGNPQKPEDSLDALAGFYLGPLTCVFSFALHSLSFPRAEDGSLFYQPVFETFDSFKLAGELGWKPSIAGFGTLDLRTKLGYTSRAENDPLWELSFNGSIKPGKWGRLGLKIASADFPEKWSYTLTWRFEARLP